MCVCLLSHGSFTTVRKSTRGKNIAKDEREEEKESSHTDVPPPTLLDYSSSLDKDTSLLSGGQAEVASVSQVDIDVTCAGQEPQPEHRENPNQETEQCVEQGEEEKQELGKGNIKGL